MLLTNDVLKKIEMRNILDLSIPMDNTIDIVMKKWEYDLMSSDKMGYTPDLVSFLYSLLNRKAIIVIPKYKATTTAQNFNENVHVIQENRHGRLVGIQGNAKTFSFTIKIVDMNVINGDSVGEIRCFRLTDPEGNWYKGIDKLQVVGINESKSDSDDIKFDFFVDPKRWIEFYNEKYFITKSLIQRLKTESSYYYQCIKKMLDDGIEYPKFDKKNDWPSTDKKGEKKLIKLFSSEVFHPDYTGEFPILASNQNNLIYLTARRNTYIYSIVPRLQFITRAIEYAFFHVDEKVSTKEKIEGEWKDIKIKRTEWKEFNLGDVGIRKRVYEKNEVV